MKNWKKSENFEKNWKNHEKSWKIRKIMKIQKNHKNSLFFTFFDFFHFFEKTWKIRKITKNQKNHKKSLFFHFFHFFWTFWKIEKWSFFMIFGPEYEGKMRILMGKWKKVIFCDFWPKFWTFWKRAYFGPLAPFKRLMSPKLAFFVTSLDPPGPPIWTFCQFYVTRWCRTYSYMTSSPLYISIDL